MALPDEFAAIDFDHFHRVALPPMIDGQRARDAARTAVGLRSLALRLTDGSAFTYRVDADRVVLLPGESTATTVIEIDEGDWQGLVHELETPAGLLYAGRVRSIRGNGVDLMAWESALRALYNGRPPYEPGGQSWMTPDGRALDPDACFTLANDDHGMAQFLDTMGYLFVRDIFSAEETSALRREARELEEEARPGDKLSWWGKNGAGANILGRITRGLCKPHLAALPNDPRLQRLKALADPGFVYRVGEGEGVTVIFKRPDMREGLGDLPWHRDCGMGGHAVMCPTVVISVYLTESTEETGELMMLPGSHRSAYNAHDRRGDLSSYAAHFRARPGDLSIHYSDTVHAAPPPTDLQRDTYRISAIVSFARPQAQHHRGEASYNDVLHQSDDGQIEHLESVARRR